MIMYDTFQNHETSVTVVNPETLRTSDQYLPTLLIQERYLDIDEENAFQCTILNGFVAMTSDKLFA